MIRLGFRVRMRLENPELQWQIERSNTNRSRATSCLGVSRQTVGQRPITDPLQPRLSLNAYSGTFILRERQLETTSSLQNR